MYRIELSTTTEKVRALGGHTALRKPRSVADLGLALADMVTEKKENSRMTHILVIDDEAPVRALVRQMLEAAGYQVSEASEGEAGIALLRTFPIALLITDIFMPGKEGIETILEVRKHFPQVKLLAISGGTKLALAPPLPDAHRFGAQYTLAKPFTAEELLLAVRTILAQ